MCCVLSRVQRFVTPWTVARQAPLSVGFSRQEYWSGLPFPSPGDLPDLGIEPRSPVSPASQADSLPLSHRGSPQIPHLLSPSFCESGIQAQFLTEPSGLGSRIDCSQNVEGFTSKLTHVIVSRIQFLASVWTEGLNCSLALDWKPPGIPCHIDLTNMAGCFIETSKRVCWQEGIQNLGTTMEASSHHHILFVRGESLGSVHTLGEQMGVNTKKWWLWSGGGGAS